MTEQKKEKKVKEVEVKEELKPSLKFICNVNFNNKEYKQDEEWSGEVPKELEQFLK